jgi:hypothetical protein
VARYPLCVHSRDDDGNTLCHYAVKKENDRLLSILLQAKLPRFWFPLNNHNQDILGLAVDVKSRACVKLILDKLVEAKKADALAPLPAEGDRFLRNLLKVTNEFHDLVAGFLSDFGFDEVPDKVTLHTLHHFTSDDLSFLSERLSLAS